MELTERQSGLVVPVEKEDPPRRKYGAVEIRDEDRRDEVKRVMHELWTAMDCQHWGSFDAEDRAARVESRRKMFRFVGVMLFGEDECPDGDILT